LEEVDLMRMRHQGANSTYWGNIKEGVSSLLGGLRLSFRHLLEARSHRNPIGVEDAHYFEQDKGIVTLQYPHESIPVPDHGRYKLHNEIEDCIVCDKCAKICPVNCIEIEPIRAVEEIGKTSDGSSKRIYPAKFDIDMGKCCFCGLCTTVCPTECLTMTKEYDFSEFDVADHNFAFSNMTPLEILEKKKELEEFVQQKEKAKAEAAAKKEDTGTPATPKPAFKPKATAYKPKAGMMKPKIKPKSSEDTPQEMAKKIMQEKRKAEQKEDPSNPSEE
jgi:formate hydrogenlyase subunit 6/NADH:ubiquinone oxidoreductase subunit I